MPPGRRLLAPSVTFDAHQLLFPVHAGTEGVQPGGITKSCSASSEAAYALVDWRPAAIASLAVRDIDHDRLHRLSVTRARHRPGPLARDPGHRLRRVALRPSDPTARG